MAPSTPPCQSPPPLVTWRPRPRHSQAETEAAACRAGEAGEAGRSRCEGATLAPRRQPGRRCAGAGGLTSSLAGALTGGRGRRQGGRREVRKLDLLEFLQNKELKNDTLYSPTKDSTGTVMKFFFYMFL